MRHYAHHLDGQPGYPLHIDPERGIFVGMAVMVHWNGKDVPEELRVLPEGRYVIESVDAAPALSPDEEAGLEQAIDSLRRGQGVQADAVFRRVEERLRRRGSSSRRRPNKISTRRWISLRIAAQPPLRNCSPVSGRWSSVWPMLTSRVPSSNFALARR